jgi:hypothetical protein
MKKDDEVAIEDAVNDIEDDQQQGKAEDTSTEQPDTGLESVVYTPPRHSRKRKLIVALIIVALLVGTFMAVPFLRYGLAGFFVSKQVVLTVVDSANQKPVSDAKVSLGRYDGVTDAKGRAVINGVPVGEYTLEVTKKNYKLLTGTHTVPILMPAKDTTKKIQATGRTVTFTFTNAISGQVVAGVAVDIEGSTAVSDDKGVANVVVPIKQTEQVGTAKAEGYNTAEVKVQMKTNDDQKISVKLTPTGKLYFLSKRTGTINVMSADLDGTNQAVVLQGTGKELDGETSLLPSPGWTSLMLIARRDADRAKLYSLTTNGQLKLVDDADVSYQPIGWVAGRFYYKTVSNSLAGWQNKAETIASYNPESGQRQEVDGTLGSGTNYYDMVAQHFTTPAIVDGKVVYAKYWNYGGYVTEKSRSTNIVAVTVEGNIKTVLKEVPATTDIYGDAGLTKPGVYVVRLGRPDNGKEYYQYTAGKVAVAAIDDTAFYNNRVSYQMSPDGSKAFWAEVRDGKTIAFEASKDLTGGTQVSATDYAPYGWYTDSYVLYSKNMSELYIAPAGSPLDGAHKITDYHKAAGYQGYGWGAGGGAY